MLRSKILYETLSAQYTFLWNASLADPEALEAACDRMIEDGACYEMPIDSNAVLGRILIMAIEPSNPAKAAEVFETLIGFLRTPVKPITSSKRYPKNFDLTCAKLSNQANSVVAELQRLAPLRQGGAFVL